MAQIDKRGRPDPAAPARSGWGALDEETRSLPGDPEAPGAQDAHTAPGFNMRWFGVSPETAADWRVRMEMPALGLWLIVSCFWRGLAPWIVMGALLIGWALFTRVPFKQYRRGAQTWIYAGFGLGQILFALAAFQPMPALWPVVGPAWVALIAAWGVTELRGFFGSR